MFLFKVSYRRFVIRQGYYINGAFLYPSDTVGNFFKKNYGLGSQISTRFEERFETFRHIKIEDQEEYKLKSLDSFLYSFVPAMADYKSRLGLGILFLDLISTYRGWRHSKGLPVRGQRTWSNAWSCYRSNLILREVKLKIAKKYYGNLPENEINMAFLAEDINSLWRIQWEHEWKSAKKRLKLSEKNSKKSPIKVDLASMAQGNIIVDNITKKKLKANRRKRTVQKNVFTLGFDPGFTKFVLKNVDDLNKQNKTTLAMLSTSKTTKKIVVKKKIDVKATKIAHKTKKKNKKSLWE